MKHFVAPIFTWVLAASGLARAEDMTHTSPEQRKEAKMIVVGITNAPPSLDPRDFWSMHHFAVSQCLYQTIVKGTESGDIVADLAESWQVSADRRTYRFRLNPLARFRDGEPVTASDAAFSLARHLWQGSPSVLANYLRQLILGASSMSGHDIPSGIRVLSDHELEIVLIEPYSPFLQVLAMPSFGIMEKRAAEKSEFIGSGPYLVREKTSSAIRLRINPAFTGKTPADTEILVKIFSHPDDAILAVEQSELDVAYGIPLKDVERASTVPGYAVSKTNSFAFSHFFFNTAEHRWRDKTLRRDIAAIIYSAVSSQDSRSTYLEFNPSYLPKRIMPAEYYARNLPKASPEEFSSRWGTILGTKAIRVAVFEPYHDRTFTDAMLQKFKEAHVAVELDVVEPPRLRDVMSHHRYDLLLAPYAGSYADPDGLLDPIAPGTRLKYGAFDTTALFAEIAKIRFMEPQQARLAAYAKALISFEQEWFVIPMYQLNLPIVHSKNIHVPDTSYRFEAELSNFFWNTK